MICWTVESVSGSRRTPPMTPRSASRLCGGRRSTIGSGDMAGPSDASVPRLKMPRASAHGVCRRLLLLARLERDDEHLDGGLDSVAEVQRHGRERVRLADRVFELHHVRLDEQVLALEGLADVGGPDRPVEHQVRLDLAVALDLR